MDNAETTVSTSIVKLKYCSVFETPYIKKILAKLSLLTFMVLHSKIKFISYATKERHI